LRSRIRGLIQQRLPDKLDILAEIEAAQISTIHALASRICAENSELAGIPSNFKVLEDAKGKIWLQASIDSAIADLPPEYFSEIPYSVMKSSLNCLLNDPHTANLALEQKEQDWQELIFASKKQAFEALFKHSTWQAAREVLENNIGKADDKLEAIRQDVISAIAALEQENYNQEFLNVLESIKINVGSKKNWQDIKLIKDTLKDLRDLIKTHLKSGLINLELGAVDEQLKEILPTFKAAFKHVTNYLTELKQQARVLTFTDLEIYALKALAHPQVQERYQQQWRVFLVDEFQDTNPTQAELLTALTAQSELTIVGDIKQSIYGFRRADIQIFEDFRKRILATQGKEVVLGTSFRTHQPLVTQVNQIFEPLFGSYHQDLNAFRQLAPDQNNHLTGESEQEKIPYIRALAIASEPKTDKAHRQLQEAKEIALQIKQLLDRQTLIHDKQTQTLRPITPGDILVLTRTWSPLEVYGEAIAALGIPIAPAGGGNLLATREVKDGWALLRFLADSQDDIALVAVLRSPWFTISDRVLFQVAQNTSSPRDSGEQNSSWWQKIQLSQESSLVKAVQILTKLLRLSDRESPSRLLQQSDRLTGYTAVISNLRGGKRRYADWQGFNNLIQELETGVQDIFCVVRDLKQLYDNEAEIPRPPLEVANAVGLMTIYAAKGLEKSLVVVADLSKEKPSSSPAAYFSRQRGVALKLKDEGNDWQKPVLYKWLENQKKQQESTESLRVLYVALTRARDYLLLTASQADKGDMALLSSGLMAANIPIEIIPVVEADSLENEAAEDPQPTNSQVTKPIAEKPINNKTLLTQSVGSGIFELPVTALSEYALCPYRFQLQYLLGHPGIGEGIGHGREIGSLIHTALEYNLFDVKQLKPFASFNWQQDSSPDSPTETVDEAIALVAKFLDSKVFKPFRDRGTKKEQPISLQIGAIKFSGIVDLLGDDWLLDYKSDRQINPEHHHLQLWAYAEALGYQKAHIAYLRHDYLYSLDVEQLTAIASQAKQLVDGISAGNFHPQASFSTCQYCSYSSLCEFACLEQE